MANLIITIISIALVAVAALMGAYYGGQIWQEAQAKAIANSIVKGGQQISAAILARRATEGMQTPVNANDADSLGGFTGLSPAYLSSFPALREDLVNITAAANSNTFQNGWRIGTNTSVDGVGTVLGYRVVLFINFLDSPVAQKVCEAIYAMHGFSPSVPLVVSNAADPTFINWYTNYGAKAKTTCFIRDANANGSYSYVANSEMYRVMIFVN